ncbi:macro domain-containing protein [Chryseobacterium oranimense]|uniref:macro domain-containing protein n=1 Tax=Chryseobacterium oranimense TaxID=421058 RepID=UPI0021AF492A|nr:macro domain-containing protein [Chryseobacterium oranimense]UWX60374.1 macro domain-containing protein [Chryseobacterium oranimense]
MVTYIYEGDIFSLEGVSNFAHGCNCAGAMGKGIALQFKTKYPKMYKEYKALCQEGLFLLGDVFIYKCEAGTIFNLGTQTTWRTKADLNSIENAFEKMLSYSNLNKINKIALPKIGAGLGGLDWNDVKRIVEKLSKNYPQIDLWIVENYKSK